MNKILKIGLILLLICYSIYSYADKYINYPRVTYRSHNHCVIHKIHIEDDYTEIFFYYRTPYSSNSWVNFSLSTTLKDLSNGKRYSLIGAKGIPLYPQRHRFSTLGQGVSFSLIFPKIPEDTEYIEINENIKDGFRFIILLKSDRTSYSIQYNEMNEFIKNIENTHKEKQFINNNENNNYNQYHINSKTTTQKQTRKKKELKKNPNFKID